MENTFLLKETGKEDYYEFVGTREDLDDLLKNEVTYVLYPGSNKTVGVSFRESNDPRIELKKEIKAGKRSEITGTIYFVIISGLTIYGAFSLLHKIVSGF